MKRESRILGISASETIRKQIAVIGVVFRGNQWLDGIIVCHLRPLNSDNVSALARAIIKCKQYSQIHAVILAGERFLLRTRIDMTELSNVIDRPIIMIGRSRSRQIGKHKKRSRSTLSNHYRVKLSGKSLSVLATKLSFTETSEILSLACVKDSMMPEAVRVAQLIARHASDLYAFKLQRTLVI